MPCADFWQNRIDATKALIIAFEDAVQALSAQGGVQSYSIDTGQTRQTVTRADLPSLNRQIDALHNRLVTLELRVNGRPNIAGPAW